MQPKIEEIKLFFKYFKIIWVFFFFFNPWANGEQKYLSFFESLGQQGAEIFEFFESLGQQGTEVECYSFHPLPGPGSHQEAATAYGEPSKILSSGLKKNKKQNNEE